MFASAGFFKLKFCLELFPVYSSVIKNSRFGGFSLVLLHWDLCQVPSWCPSPFFPSMCYQCQLGVLNQPWSLMVTAAHGMSAWDMCWAPPAPQHHLRLWELQRVRVLSATYHIWIAGGRRKQQSTQLHAILRFWLPGNSKEGVFWAHWLPSNETWNVWGCFCGMIVIFLMLKRNSKNPACGQHVDKKKKTFTLSKPKSFLLGQKKHYSKLYLHPQTNLLMWNPSTGLQWSTSSVLLQMEMVFSVPFLDQPFSVLSLLYCSHWKMSCGILLHSTKSLGIPTSITLRKCNWSIAMIWWHTAPSPIQISLEPLLLVCAGRAASVHDREWWPRLQHAKSSAPLLTLSGFSPDRVQPCWRFSLGDILGDGEASTAKELEVFAKFMYSYRGKMAGFYKTK